MHIQCCLDASECADELRNLADAADLFSRRLARVLRHADRDPSDIINTVLVRQLAMLEELPADLNTCADKLEDYHELFADEHAD